MKSPRLHLTLKVIKNNRIVQTASSYHKRRFLNKLVRTMAEKAYRDSLFYLKVVYGNKNIFNDAIYSYYPELILKSYTDFTEEDLVTYLMRKENQ